ncbi:uncharacterized protein LOC112126727 [Cimex lectularius]|uniref:Uncharacterized protein n=1 Tax=Cimex lectularius TaxID=79782 RepID=A0A8I6ST28_CIMLE|nr:uncharacterized protein LOC112126727 [Cimex lectularius]
MHDYCQSKMFCLTLLIVVCINFTFGSYCNTDECPGYSVINSSRVTYVDHQIMEFKWECRERYKNQVHSYEVHWLSSENCTDCNGKTEVVNKTELKINIRPCINYTIEIYPLDSMKRQIKAPGIFSQVSASNALKNGSALIIDKNWVILRWLVEKHFCVNSSYIAACHGPNTVSFVIEETLQDVVLVNISGLMEKSSYVCGAFSINPAGLSAGTNPIFLTTEQSTVVLKIGKVNTYIYTVLLGILALLIMLMTLIMCFLKQLLLMLPWRGSYSVNDVRESYEF